MTKYLFIHVPKTAGVKVRRNIHMNAGPGCPGAKVCIQEEGDDLRYYTDAELSQFDLLSGHFGFALRKRLEEGRQCITMLRKPLERIISGYFYWKTLRDDSLLARESRELSIYDFAESNSPVVKEYIDNSQTWQLYWDFEIRTRRRFSDVPREQVLESAKANLASLDFVGLQEDLPGTLKKMQQKFSWRWIDEPYKKINETSYDAALIDRERLREALGQRIALDEDLYSFAQQLYEKI